MYIKLKILALFFLLAITSNIEAQDDAKAGSPEGIFNNIETGIKEINVKMFSDYFQSETFVSLLSGISGNFSSNQLFFVIQDFINTYKPISFRIAKISSGAQYSFATGFYDYSYEGIRGVAKFYISLKLDNNNWRISQISIN